MRIEIRTAVKKLKKLSIQQWVDFLFGGRIDYIGFKEGTVYLQLKGACAGCPGAASTLKFGIENMLKQELTEVKTVVAVNG